MSAAPDTNALTIYLGRPNLRPEDLIPDSSSVPVYPLHIGEDTQANLYVQPSAEKPPDWAGLFAGHIDPSVFGKNRSTGAVLLAKRDSGCFALTFGTGRFLIDTDKCEDRFGLKVTLNCIGEGTVRSIEKHSLDVLLRHTREQASRDATPREFGFDVEQDLLRAVTGKPTDTSSFGQRMSGADSLHITLPFRLAELPDLLNSIHAKFIDTNYRTKYPWIDQIAEVRNPALEAKLDDLLMRGLAAGDLDRVWMAVPQIISWTEVRGFRFPTRKRSPEYEDIHIEHFLKTPGYTKEENAAAIKQRRVVAIDHDGRDRYQWSAFRCTYAELEHEDRSYLLTGGKWYEVESDFVKETNKAFERIPNCEITFPAFHDGSEAAYLARVCADDNKRFALMDQKDIFIAKGQSPIEFCDLFTSDGDIVHVKRYGQSSVLSHLFAQGLISGECFRGDKNFRAQVNKLLPKSHTLTCINDGPKPGQFRVVYAVISDREGVLQIPFFSRLNVKNAAKRLEMYGFRVAKAKICVDHAYSKTAKFRLRAPARGVGSVPTKLPIHKKGA